MDIVLVSISAASKALSLGRSKVYELIQSGDLDVVKIGRRALIPADSIRALVANLERQA